MSFCGCFCLLVFLCSEVCVCVCVAGGVAWLILSMHLSSFPVNQALHKRPAQTPLLCQIIMFRSVVLRDFSCAGIFHSSSSVTLFSNLYFSVLLQCYSSFFLVSPLCFNSLPWFVSSTNSRPRSLIYFEPIYFEFLYFCPLCGFSNFSVIIRT